MSPTPRAFLLAGFLLGVYGALAWAAPPEGADPTFAPWYRSLQSPDGGGSCCSLADCRPRPYKTVGDHYEVDIDDQWMPVPPEKILQHVSNPTGRAVVCYTPSLGILCFVRPSDA